MHSVERLFSSLSAVLERVTNRISPVSESIGVVLRIASDHSDKCKAEHNEYEQHLCLM